MWERLGVKFFDTVMSRGESVRPERPLSRVAGWIVTCAPHAPPNEDSRIDPLLSTLFAFGAGSVAMP